MPRVYKDTRCIKHTATLQSRAVAREMKGARGKGQRGEHKRAREREGGKETNGGRWKREERSNNPAICCKSERRTLSHDRARARARVLTKQRIWTFWTHRWTVRCFNSSAPIRTELIILLFARARSLIRVFRRRHISNLRYIYIPRTNNKFRLCVTSSKTTNHNRGHHRRLRI